MMAAPVVDGGVAQYRCSGLRPEVSPGRRAVGFWYCVVDLQLWVVLEQPGVRGTPSAPVTRPGLALALLVTRVALADHHDAALAANHTAVFADGLDAGVDLHGSFLVLAGFVLGRIAVPFLSSSRITCSGRRSGRGSGRTGSAPRSRGPRGGCGCSAGASSRRCARGPCVRSSAQRGTSRWAELRAPSLRSR
ncbi:hypothetical protein BACI9J_810002 [Bacillus altitudinis]|nr:hypothetical protein BACI9J_810002 [Bacillus altitudinis]